MKNENETFTCYDCGEVKNGKPSIVDGKTYCFQCYQYRFPNTPLPSNKKSKITHYKRNVLDILKERNISLDPIEFKDNEEFSNYYDELERFFECLLLNANKIKKLEETLNDLKVSDFNKNNILNKYSKDVISILKDKINNIPDEIINEDFEEEVEYKKIYSFKDLEEDKKDLLFKAYNLRDYRYNYKIYKNSLVSNSIIKELAKEEYLNLDLEDYDFDELNEESEGVYNYLKNNIINVSNRLMWLKKDKDDERSKSWLLLDNRYAINFVNLEYDEEEENYLFKVVFIDLID